MRIYFIAGNDDYDGESTKAMALDEEKAREHADAMVAGAVVGPAGNTLSAVDWAVVYAVEDEGIGVAHITDDDRVYIARRKR